MKKLIIFASLATFVMTSCTSEEPMPQAEVTDESNAAVAESFSRTRTLDEAAKIASEAIGLLPQGDSRGAGRTFRKEDVKYGIARSQSRSGGNDTLMYVFNFDDDQGFAVVAADKAVDGLIAVTELGSYDPDVTPDNPGLADYMARTRIYLKSITPKVDTTINRVSGVIPGLTQYKMFSDTTINSNIKPNFNLRWGQNFPEGLLCDNGWCGCANLALAMAISYFKNPISEIEIRYTLPLSTMSLDWNIIKSHHQSFTTSNEAKFDGCAINSHTQISKLLRQIGYLTHSTYSSDNRYTTTTISGVVEALPHLNIQNHLILEKIMSEAAHNLISNHEKLIAFGLNSTSSIGHAWIIDGYYKATVQKGEWTKEGDGPWVLMNDLGQEIIELHHMNWGDNGKGNGYFNIASYSSKNAVKYDEGCEPGEVGFTEVKFLPIKSL